MWCRYYDLCLTEASRRRWLSFTCWYCPYNPLAKEGEKGRRLKMTTYRCAACSTILEVEKLPLGNIVEVKPCEACLEAAEEAALDQADIDWKPGNEDFDVVSVAIEEGENL